MLPTPAKRTVRCGASIAATATVAPRVGRSAAWTCSMIAFGSRVPASSNARTAVRAASAASTPCPRPSATKTSVSRRRSSCPTRRPRTPVRLPPGPRWTRAGTASAPGRVGRRSRTSASSTRPLPRHRVDVEGVGHPADGAQTVAARCQPWNSRRAGSARDVRHAGAGIDGEDLQDGALGATRDGVNRGHAAAGVLDHVRGRARSPRWRCAPVLPSKPQSRASALAARRASAAPLGIRQRTAESSVSAIG